MKFEIPKDLLENSKPATKMTLSHTTKDRRGLKIQGKIMTLTLEDVDGYSITYYIHSLSDFLNVLIGHAIRHGVSYSYGQDSYEI